MRSWSRVPPPGLHLDVHLNDPYRSGPGILRRTQSAPGIGQRVALQLGTASAKPER
jgi:hypothetical protein